jgi:hypothetical protein
VRPPRPGFGPQREREDGALRRNAFRGAAVLGNQERAFQEPLRRHQEARSTSVPRDGVGPTPRFGATRGSSWPSGTTEQRHGRSGLPRTLRHARAVRGGALADAPTALRRSRGRRETRRRTNGASALEGPTRGPDSRASARPPGGRSRRVESTRCERSPFFGKTTPGGNRTNRGLPRRGRRPPGLRWHQPPSGARHQRSAGLATPSSEGRLDQPRSPGSPNPPLFGRAVRRAFPGSTEPTLLGGAVRRPNGVRRHRRSTEHPRHPSGYLRRPTEHHRHSSECPMPPNGKSRCRCRTSHPFGGYREGTSAFGPSGLECTGCSVAI